MDTRHPLILIDGSSFLYRAYFAAKGGFSTRSGLPTGAVLIITRMLKNLAKEFADSKVLTFFDAPGKTFRNEMYADYKANRPPMPEDLRAQIPYVRRITEALGFTVVSESGVEADDLMGSYALKARELGFSVIICTGDKDLAQLVREGVTLKDTLKGEDTDREGVIKRFGVPPERIVDYLALKGDSADNIPGMPGVGDVTALALINGLGGIYDIKAHADQIASLKFRGCATFARKFEQYFPQVELSYKLATIHTDLPLPVPLEDITVPVKKREILMPLYKELEFNRFYEEEALEMRGGKAEDLDAGRPPYLRGRNVKISSPLPEGCSDPDCAAEESAVAPSPAPSADGSGMGDLFSALDGAAGEKEEPSEAAVKAGDGPFESRVVLTEEALEAAVRDLSSGTRLALSAESTLPHFKNGRLVGIALCGAADRAYYIPLSHDLLGEHEQLPLATVRAALEPLLINPEIEKVSADLKFTYLLLKEAGIALAGKIADTGVLYHLLNSSRSADLSAVVSDCLDLTLLSPDTVLGKGVKRQLISSLRIDDVLSYVCEKAVYTYRVLPVLLQRAKKIPGCTELFYDSEMAFLKALTHMQGNGATVDDTVLKRENAEFHRELADLERRIHAAAGEVFNIQSPRQLGTILFEKLKLPYPKRPKVAADGSITYSTAEEILQELAPSCELASLALRYRLLSKLVSTYTEKLPELVVDGRIYTTFTQTGTNTGRLSSSDPNLQNIPARTAEGKRIRKAFIAPQGYKVLSADYSQIELRLIAHFSGDPELIGAFLNGEDIHRHTAAQVLGKAPEDVTPEERSSAKATNFGIMYGISPHGLSKMTGMSFRAAKQYIQAYFDQYPAVHAYMESVKADALSRGYVTTLYGRRVTFGSPAGGAIARAAVERAAINAPMQGSAADIIKKAMVDIDRWIGSLDAGLVRMTLQVHDELIFEVREDFAEAAAERIRSLMEGAAALKVPLEVGIGIADNWADAH